MASNGDSDMASNGDFKKLQYLLCFVGASNTQNTQNTQNTPTQKKIFRLVSLLVWFMSLFIHFSWDIYESHEIYGHTFLVAQALWFISLLVSTWATSYRALPWLLVGQEELKKEECYAVPIQKLQKLFRTAPYIVLIFGLVASGIQHTMFHIDGALHLDFGQGGTNDTIIGLQVIRFAAGFHVYTAWALFWIVPTSVMLMTGYSMTEFREQMSAKMKNRDSLLTFKEAISSYSKRAKFVKTSSSKTLCVLTILLLAGVLCFGLNAYVFLFGTRHFLHVWHSLLPVLMMIYPLCTAAWVTKQYTWFIITVVRAWVDNDDLDDTSDEDSGIDDETNNNNQQPETKRNLWGAIKTSSLKQSSENNSAGDSKEAEDKLLPLWQKPLIANTADQLTERNENKTTDPLNERNETKSPGFGAAVKVITAANRFRKNARRPRFNFEKFLSYLESMRPTVGFHIAGIMVTWDLVSTTLFLLFSVIAVFMQESIFGSQKSTL